MDERETGAILEAIKNLKEDQKADRELSKESRDQQRAATEKLVDQFNELRMAVNGQTQTMNSLGNRIIALDAEKCDERLKALEIARRDEESEREKARIELARVGEEVRFYQRAFGGAWGITFRLGGLLAGIGGLVEAVHKWG